MAVVTVPPGSAMEYPPECFSDPPWPMRSIRITRWLRSSSGRIPSQHCREVVSPWSSTIGDLSRAPLSVTWTCPPIVSTRRPPSTVLCASLVCRSVAIALRIRTTSRAARTPIRIFQRRAMEAVTLAALRMEKFVIKGGAPLSGEITAAGNKNAALLMLAACLLTEEELRISNVPRIRDVESMLTMLERMGVKVEWTSEHEVSLQADAINPDEVDEESSTKIRASLLAAGPPLALLRRAQMAPP